MSKFAGIGILIIIFISQSLPIFCLQSTPQDNLNKRIDGLEQEKLDLKNRIAVLEGQKENIDTRVSNHIENINKKWQILEWFLGFLGIGSVAVWITLLFKLKKIAEKKLEEKFDKLFEAKRGTIKEMIEFQNEELQIKRTKKILVVNPSGTDGSFLMDFFKENGFYSVKECDFREIIDLHSYDLIFINNENEGFKEKELNDLVGRIGRGSIGFHFGPKQIEKENMNKIACANFRVQLYGNLINALRYQNLIH